MMKKILPFAIVIGVVSLVACSALGSCNLQGTRVLEADAGFTAQPKKANDYTTNSYNMGMFDSVDEANRVIRRQTGYLDIVDIPSGVSYLGEAGDYHMWAIVNDGFITAMKDASSNYHGYGYVNYGYWSQVANPPNDFPANNVYSTFARTPNNRLVIFTHKGILDSVNVSDLANLFPKGYHLQYKLATYTTEQFNNAINGDNMNSAYEEGNSEGYSSGYSAGYAEGIKTNDTDQFIKIERGANSKSFRVRVNDGSGVVVDQNIDSSNTYLDLRRPEGTNYAIRLTSNDSNENYFNIQVLLDNVSYTLTSSMVADGWVYMPTWYSNVVITISTTADTTLGGSFYGVDFDPEALDYVFIGSRTQWEQGYSAGYEDGARSGYYEGYDNGAQEGYSQGYSNGYNAGEDAMDNAGQAVNNLFGAIVNIPVNVLNGLSGFTIWSVPLLSIIFTFLFLGVVIWIVRKFI